MKVLLVFRRYDDRGFAVNGERPIERECTEEDKADIVKELNAQGYELEYAKRIP